MLLETHQRQTRLKKKLKNGTAPSIFMGNQVRLQLVFALILN